MDKQAIETRFDFEITHQVGDGGVHKLTIKPCVKTGQVDRVVITVSEQQWNALRFGFMTAVNDKLKITKLAYLV